MFKRESAQCSANIKISSKIKSGRLVWMKKRDYVLL